MTDKGTGCKSGLVFVGERMGAAYNRAFFISWEPAFFSRFFFFHVAMESFFQA